jgi:hypothetical protein
MMEGGVMEGGKRKKDTKKKKNENKSVNEEFAGLVTKLIYYFVLKSFLILKFHFFSFIFSIYA